MPEDYNKQFSRNNFDLVRLFAAVQVMLLHGAEHLRLDLEAISFLKLFPGVPIFFAVSGFLISASWDRSKNLKTYALNRVLRIYPALWVCLLFSITIILASGVIFRFGEFLPWLIAQGSFFQFYNPDFLRGFGVGVINGSLWTIPVELQFYILLPLCFFAFKWLAKREINNRGLLIIFGFFLMVAWCFSLLKEEDVLWIKLFAVSAAPHFYLFLFGWLLQRNFDRVKFCLCEKGIWWLSGYVVTAVAVKLSFLHVPQSAIFLNLLLALSVISLAYTKTDLAEKVLRRNDISYGVYIYHMLLVNLLVEAGMRGEWTGYIILIFGTLIMALFSWRFVEKPFLALKKTTIKKMPFYQSQ